MRDPNNHIVADNVHGGWRVRFTGRLIKQFFKTHEEAYQFLEKLMRKTAQPEFEA